MKILAIDTSTTSGSVALVEKGKAAICLEEKNVEAHAKWLLPAIDALFTEAASSIEDIDIIAIGVGPGSFTGLRIGVSTVKGLAFALNKPIVGVSTLKALAMNVHGPALICPILDARKKQVYAALYRTDSEDGDLEEVMGDRAITPALLCEEIKLRSSAEELLFLGTGLNVYKEIIVSSIEGAVFAPKDDWRIRAENIALLAELDDAEQIAASSLAPLYRRRSEAEINEG
ncbi:MAG: tRNA (adenosine(37)-N6)-threonylcarbamoyltransferase complex dimerization subunit type 1 TsaB [Thermodesulfobacteriota bacterium]